MTDASDRDLAVAQCLGRIEAKVTELSERVAESMEQAKDHARRIERIERLQAWAGGWLAGAFALGAFAEWLLGRAQ